MEAHAHETQSISSAPSLPTAPAVVREQAGGETMRAIVLEKLGGPDSLVYTGPAGARADARPGRHRNQGIRSQSCRDAHAQRRVGGGGWERSIGIECMGWWKSCPGGEFPVGAKVAALIGSLGRTINGSYAEYTRVRGVEHRALIESDLPWADLAAIPETYATTWTCLFQQSGDHPRGQTLVIRGRRILIRPGRAQHGGRRGPASHRHDARCVSGSPCWQQLHAAEHVEAEAPDLCAPNCRSQQLDAVLDLVGNSTILDSLDMLRRGGRACLAGWLGGLAPIPDSTRCCRWRAACT